MLAKVLAPGVEHQGKSDLTANPASITAKCQKRIGNRPEQQIIHEARIALDDKYSGLELLGGNLIRETNARNLVITLSDKGFISFQYDPEEDYIKSQHFPALTVNPVDVIGAGDASLSGLSLSLCAGAGLMEASAVAAGVASMAVNKVGNTPVAFHEVKEWLRALENTVK